MACTAPVVTMTSSGSVGSPRAQYLSAIAARSVATPLSSWPELCRNGVTWWTASVNASTTAAAGAASAAAARLTVAGGGSGCGAAGDRQRGGAAGSPPGIQVAVLAQLRVCGGDRRARHPQRVGKRPFAGQSGADREPPVDDQHPDAVGKALVGRPAATGRAPVPKLAGQEVHIERSRDHFYRHRKPVCANWLLNSKPVAVQYSSHEHELDVETGRPVGPTALAGASPLQRRRRRRRSSHPRRTGRHPGPLPGPRVRTNWTARLAQARAAVFRVRPRAADAPRGCVEPDRITVRFREHG